MDIIYDTYLGFRSLHDRSKDIREPWVVEVYDGEIYIYIS